MNYLERRIEKLEDNKGKEVTYIFINPTETNEQIIARIVLETGAPPKFMFVLHV